MEEIVGQSGADARPTALASADTLCDRLDHFASEYAITERSKVGLALGDLSDSAIVFLLDQSGSVWDHAPEMSAHTASVATRLEQAGAAVRVAGFTSVGWKGGQPRALWQSEGKPAFPGRSCALMHVIYSDFDDQTEAAALQPFVTTQCLFENVDSEALEWAEDALKGRSEPRKVIVIISDGAPVDDSTILENGTDYLLRHLKAVIARLEADPTLALGAVGIDHWVSDLYTHASTIENPAELFETTLDLAEELLAQA